MSDLRSDFQLKDENGQLMGVETSNLLIANSGNDLPVRIEVLYYLLVFLVEWLFVFFSEGRSWLYSNSPFIFSFLAGY